MINTKSNTESFHVPPVLVFSCYLADGAKSEAHFGGLLAHTRADFHGLLQRNSDKSQILSYTEISAFSDNALEPDKNDENYDRLWKFYVILAINEMIVFRVTLSVI
jgi:hypothetical protein